MKKYILFTLILLLFGGICAYAGYNFQAKDIPYIKPDGIETNIQSAMTELFNKEVSIFRSADIPSGTTIQTQPGDYLIIASVTIPINVTNSNIVSGKASGGSANGITSDTTIYKATGTSCTITMHGDYRFTYFLIR